MHKVFNYHIAVVAVAVVVVVATDIVVGIHQMLNVGFINIFISFIKIL